MTRKSGEHLRTETLDSCFDLIRFHQQYIPWSPLREIEPATTYCRAKTLQLCYRPISYTSGAKLSVHQTYIFLPFYLFLRAHTHKYTHTHTHTHIYIYIYIYIYILCMTEFAFPILKNQNHMVDSLTKHPLVQRVVFHIYMYIYISSSSSYPAADTDIPDPLSPLLPIIHRLWQVFRAISRILT